MFCPNCGNKVKEGAKFCGECGNKIEITELAESSETVENEINEQKSGVEAPVSSGEAVNENQNVSEVQQPETDNQTLNQNSSSYGSVESVQQETQAPKSYAAAVGSGINSVSQKTGLSKNAVIGIIAGGAALLVTIVIVIIVALANRYKKVDLNELFEYEIVGANGYGTIHSGISDGSLEDAVVEALGITDGDKEDMTRIRTDYYLFSEEFGDPISYEWDKTENLSNGDSVHLTWDVNDDILKDEFGIVFTHSDIDVTVEGLSDVETIDAFEGITVSFEGMSGEGTASLDSSGSRASELEFQLDNEYNLSNGDVVTVSIYSPDGGDLSEYCSQRGYIPSETSKEFTVEGLGEYLSSAEQLSDDDIMKLKNEAESVLRAQQAEEMGDKEKLVGFEYGGIYVLSERNGSQDPHNKLYVIYTLNAKNPDGKSSVIQYCGYKNVIIESDGSITVDYNDVIHPTAGGWFSDGEGDNVYTKEGGTYLYHGYASFDDFMQKKITAEEDQYTSSFRS